jgi:hypothetical protein
MPPAADFFLTWDLPEPEQLDRWRDEFGRRIVGVEIEPRGSHAPFYAEATPQALARRHIAHRAGSAARLNRTPALAADGEDSIEPVVNLSPKVVQSQRARELPLQQGACNSPVYGG